VSKHGASIWEFQRIMMCGRLLFIDLTEDRRLMIDGIALPAKARWQASRCAGEGEFGAIFAVREKVTVNIQGHDDTGMPEQVLHHFGRQLTPAVRQ
jgi:hypothetical protein